MSSYYTLLLNMNTSPDISENDHNWVSYMVNGEGGRPANLPAHPYFSYFSSKREPVPIPVSYRHFDAGQFHASYWASHNDRGIHLWLPSIKSDDHYWATMLLVDWLCAMAKSDGCIGIFQSEINPLEVIALFASNGRLRIYFEPESQAFSASRPIRTD